MDKKILIFISMLVFISCQKPYNAPAINVNNNYLVVEGNINTGQDSTIIYLSRTVNIAKRKTINPELNAQMTIEDNHSNSYLLNSSGNGKYVSPLLNLDNSFQYRLRIKTANGQIYLSDFVSAKVSPAIDTVGYLVQNNGIHIYLNTHDPAASTHYYRWEFTETWIFQSAFESYYKIVNGLPVPRNFSTESVHQCWGNDTSRTILLGSSTKLANDVIYQAAITDLPLTSEKLENRYSVNVKQYALTATAFQYYENVKKNTEQLGSIFDAQPSEINGDIHNINNPAEPVIGYVSAGTSSQKRIYIDNRNLPNWLPVTFYDNYGCALDATILKSKEDYLFFYGTAGYLPTITKNLAAPGICVDCTFRGTVKQPYFWK